MHNPASTLSRLFIAALLLLLLTACAGANEATPPPAAPTDAVEQPTAISESAPTGPAAEPAADEPAGVPATDSEPTQPASDQLVDASAGDFPAIAVIAAEWPGLSLNDFFEESYQQLLLRSPELLTEIGLDEVYGTPGDQLNDISDGYIRETQALETAVLAHLRTYDRAALSPADQVSYDIYEYYLADLVRGHEFMYYDYPVSFFITAVHVTLTQFFTDLQPVSTRQEAENYITRLSQVQRKFDQLLAGLRIREELGIIPPDFVFQWTLPGIRETARSAPKNTAFYAAFAEKVAEVDGLSAADQEALLAAAESEIANSVIPAFQALEAYMAELEGKATADDGVWKLPDGEAYYSYALQHHTTTDMSADEIHALGLQELDRIHAEMRLLAAELGYPEDDSIPELYGRVARDGGTLYGEEILAGYEALIAEAEERVPEAFDLVPAAGVIVVGVPQGGYYISPAIDGTRPGAFYATQSGSEAAFSMPTLAYHEAVPGHHFQLAIMQELENIPSFRKGASFTANVEGWALYAERLASDLDWYAGDPYGDLGRLQGEAFRAARLAIDTGIHDQGWSFQEAEDFMVENTGLPRPMVQGQVARYIVWPGQATSYMIGMLSFLEARQQVMDAQGEAFDLKAFHNLLLTNGSMPLAVMEQVVAGYIAGLDTE